jgi:hypothetical protein
MGLQKALGIALQLGGWSIIGWAIYHHWSEFWGLVTLGLSLSFAGFMLKEMAEKREARKIIEQLPGDETSADYPRGSGRRRQDNAREKAH